MRKTAVKALQRLGLALSVVAWVVTAVFAVPASAAPTDCIGPCVDSTTTTGTFTDYCSLADVYVAQASATITGVRVLNKSGLSSVTVYVFVNGSLARTVTATGSSGTYVTGIFSSALTVSSGDDVRPAAWWDNVPFAYVDGATPTGDAGRSLFHRRANAAYHCGSSSFVGTYPSGDEVAPFDNVWWSTELLATATGGGTTTTSAATTTTTTAAPTTTTSAATTTTTAAPGTTTTTNPALGPLTERTGSAGFAVVTLLLSFVAVGVWSFRR